jgi:ABC-type sugar transport system substrate-binding protein
MKSRSIRLIQGAAAVSTLAASVFAFAGGTAAVAGAAGKKISVGFVVGAEADPFFQSMYVGAAAEAKALGVNLIWQGDPVDYSPSTQLPIIQQVLAEKPTVMVIAPTDTKALEGITNLSVKQGIPVINVDSGNANQSNITSWITGYNNQGGRAAADALATALHYSTACTAAKPCTVAVGVSSLTTSTDAARVAGFDAQVKAKYPHMKLLNAVVSNSLPTKAQQGFATEITADHLAGIFAVDGTDAEGASAAIAASGAAGKNIKVAGYDAYASNEASLKSGALAAVVSQQPALEGKLAILYAYDTAKHIKGVPHLKLIPNVLLTPANCAALCAKYVYVAS